MDIMFGCEGLDCWHASVVILLNSSCTTFSSRPQNHQVLFLAVALLLYYKCWLLFSTLYLTVISVCLHRVPSQQNFISKSGRIKRVIISVYS